MGDWEQKNLVNELARGKEVARQLQMHLNNGTSASQETREYLVQKILVSYEKALSMLTWTTSSPAGDHLQPQPSPGVSGLMSESPPSLNGSPRSDQDSDRDQEHRDHASRKRKILPRWTQQVRVNPGMGLEGPLDDGFSWRKYGQKDILGAKYPRGYYRCTHRNVQGCLATKQVQRSDEDPNIFEITYRGRHTCTQASHVPSPILASPDQNQDQVPPIELPHDHHQQNNIIMNQQQITTVLQDPYHDPVLSNFRSGLKVVTEGLDNRDDQPSFFHFASTSNVVDNVKSEDQSHGHGTFGPNSMMVGGFSPSTFVSPATSGTNYFSVPQGAGNINDHDQFGLQQQHFHNESEIAEIISAATSSAPGTQTVGNYIPFGSDGHQGTSTGGDHFDPNFSFDNTGFF